MDLPKWPGYRILPVALATHLGHGGPRGTQSRLMLDLLEINRLPIYIILQHFLL